MADQHLVAAVIRTPNPARVRRLLHSLIASYGEDASIATGQLNDGGDHMGAVMAEPVESPDDYRGPGRLTVRLVRSEPVDVARPETSE